MTKINKIKISSKCNRDKISSLDKRIKLIKALKRLTDEERSIVLNFFDYKGVNEICEIARNVLFNETTVRKNNREKLRQHLIPNKSSYEYLSHKKNPAKKRKNILVQEGKGIGLILASALPFLINLFKKRK